MTIEIWAIATLAIMLLVLTAVQGVLVPLTHGLKWGLGSRDTAVESSALQLRFARTVANHMETMAIFVPLMLLAILRDVQNDGTELAAWLVIGGRLAFIPFYLGGVFALRSIAYGTSLTGIIILIVQLLQ
jgi:uncharacterized MAPEG superfamily protein